MAKARTLGAAAAGCLILLALVVGLLTGLASSAVVAGNSVMGADEAASIDTSYKVEVNAAPDGARGGTIDGAGAVLVRDWVQGRSSASWNPLFIVTGQLWYNAFTSDYELKLWLEPDGGASGRQYAIYQSGSRFVLRTEYDGVAQVRRADFTAEELWQELQPHVKPRETR